MHLFKHSKNILPLQQSLGFFSSLPNEILIEILNKLSYPEQTLIAFLNSEFNAIVHDQGTLFASKKIKILEKEANNLYEFIDRELRDQFFNNTFAYQYSHVTETLSKLIQFGLDPSCINKDTGDTFLHYAARLCYVNLAKLLVSAGVDKNILNKEGSTATQVARDARFVCLAHSIEHNNKWDAAYAECKKEENHQDIRRDIYRLDLPY